MNWTPEPFLLPTEHYLQILSTNKITSKQLVWHSCYHLLESLYSYRLIIIVIIFGNGISQTGNTTKLLLFNYF